MITWRGGRRRVLGIASIATAAAVVVIGGVAAAVTLTNQNHSTASLTGSRVVPFKAAANVTPPVTASKCAMPTAFTFSGTLSAAAPGTVTYRWIYSSGKPGPVQTVRFTRAGSKAVTGQTVKSKTAGGGWGEITIISPIAQISNKASYMLLCGGGSVGGITARATVTPAVRTVSCATAPAGFTATGSIRTSKAERVTYYWAQSDGVNSAPATLTFTRPGIQATEPLTISPPAVSGSGTAVLVVTSPVSTASSPATYTLTCGAPTTQPTTNQTAPPTTSQAGPTDTVPPPLPPMTLVDPIRSSIGTVGTAYQVGSGVQGGDGPPFFWSVTGLPPGLTSTTQDNGAYFLMAGTPTTAGTFSVTVTVRDGEQTPQSLTESFPITINPKPWGTESPANLSGTVGTPYSGTFVATGGVTVTWAASGVPPGLSMNSVTGVLSGTPTTAGSYILSVSATNTATGETKAVGNFDFVVSPASLASCQEEVAMTAPVPGLEPAFEVDAQLGPLEDHGMTRAGHRRVVPVAGGRISGLFEAEILPGGADWQIVRSDGAVEIDTRYSARTAAGEYVHFRTSGVRSGPPEVLEALLRGEPVDPSEYYFRVAVHLETSAPRLAILEQSVFVASAIREANAVRYTAYRVT